MQVRGEIMKISKYLLIISFISMLSKPTQAFWPVLDFGEIIPIVSNVTTSIDSMNQVKDQLTQLKNTLSSIGENIKTIAAFSQDLKKTAEDAVNQATGSMSLVNKNTGLNIEIPHIINKNLEDIDGQFTIALNDITTETNNIISGNIAKVETEILEESNMQIEEEEEEEETSEEEGLKKKQDKIIKNLEEFQKDCNQIMVQMNDVLDASINTLNSAANKTKETMESLRKTITLVEDTDQSSKDKIINQIEELIQKQENLSDSAIEVIEEAKENYNKEYQKRLIEGIDNYKKVIIQYFNGDVRVEEVGKVGKSLKEDIAKIDIKVDTKALENIQSQTEDIKAMMQEIVKEIEAMKK